MISNFQISQTSKTLPPKKKKSQGSNKSCQMFTLLSVDLFL